MQNLVWTTAATRPSRAWSPDHFVHLITCALQIMTVSSLTNFKKCFTLRFSNKNLKKSVENFAILRPYYFSRLRQIRSVHGRGRYEWDNLRKQMRRERLRGQQVENYRQLERSGEYYGLVGQYERHVHVGDTEFFCSFYILNQLQLY